MSDRNNAANDNTDRNNNNGARLAKTSTLLKPPAAPGAAGGLPDFMFDEIVSIPNLYRAAYAASRGKRYNDSVAFFNFFMEKELEKLHSDLSTGRYRHGSYEVFKIYEPKERDIAKAPFRDRVVHHAIHDVIEPGIDRTFIFDSYACRVGKGTHVALERAQSFLEARKYCLHGDIKKYFPSIDHGILKILLRRHIREPRLVALIDHIIDSAQTSGSSGYCRGLPIGNLTSQFFANLYLHELDFFVKHTLKCGYYMRYMDDLLVFENDRVRLEDVRSRIGEFLKGRLLLDLHPGKSQIFVTARGVKFLGFRFYHDHRRLATQGVRRFRRRLKKFRYLLGQGLIDEVRVAQSIMCWRAHSAYANTARLWKNLRQLRVLPGF